MLTRKEVEKIAALSKIPLSERELSSFSVQLPKIISFVENLNKLDTKNIFPTYQISGKKNELRKDLSIESLPIEDILRNAENSKDNYIMTKGVLDAK